MKPGILLVVPEFVMTTSREPRNIAESYRLGANGYVAKPVRFERFRDVARQLCDYWLGPNEPPLVD
jgi:response regulator of citrate/malate metabolism